MEKIGTNPTFTHNVMLFSLILLLEETASVIGEEILHEAHRGWDLLVVGDDKDIAFASQTSFITLEKSMNETFGPRRIVDLDIHSHSSNLLVVDPDTLHHRPLLVYHHRAWWWTNVNADFGSSTPPSQVFLPNGRLLINTSYVPAALVSTPNKRKKRFRTQSEAQHLFKDWVDMITILRAALDAGRAVFVFDAAEENCIDDLHRWYTAEAPHAVFRQYHCNNIDYSSDAIPTVITLPLGIHSFHTMYDPNKDVKLVWDVNATLPVASKRPLVLTFHGSLQHRTRSGVAKFLIALSKLVNETGIDNLQMSISEPNTSNTNEVHTFNHNFIGQGYQQLLLNATFCSVPRGRVVETSRFSEALECGCIIIMDSGSLEHLEHEWPGIADVAIETDRDWRHVELDNDDRRWSSLRKDLLKCGILKLQTTHTTVCSLTEFLVTLYNHKQLIDKLQSATLEWYANTKLKQHQNIADGLQHGYLHAVLDEGTREKVFTVDESDKSAFKEYNASTRMLTNDNDQGDLSTATVDECVAYIESREPHGEEAIKYGIGPKGIGKKGQMGLCYRLGDAIKRNGPKWFRLELLRHCDERFPGSMMCEFFNRTTTRQWNGRFRNGVDDDVVLLSLVEERANQPGFPIPPPNAIVVHLRMGDGLIGKHCFGDWSDCRPREGRARNPDHYTYPKWCFESVIEKLDITAPVIIVGSTLHGTRNNAKTMAQWGCLYLTEVMDLFRKKGFKVSTRLNQEADPDFVYMSMATTYVKGVSGFSQLVETVHNATNAKYADKPKFVKRTVLDLGDDHCNALDRPNA